MLFVGKQEKGFFVEEFAEKLNMPFAYVETSAHIEPQINSILRHGAQNYIVFDVDQYIDSAELIAEQIERICRANNSAPIIFASGYLLESEMIGAMVERGYKYFILSGNLAGMKDQLEKCVNGFYDANGMEELQIVRLERQKEEEKKNIKGKLIGVVGACKRIGTTTHAMQIVRYLQLKGYKACYVQMNSTDYVKNMMEWYVLEEKDEKLGKITYSGIDHYYDANKIQEVLRLDYDYFVYDYGITSDVDFNRISFMEKDIRIFVLGTEPTELPYTYEVVRSLFYDDVHYIFNFTSVNDKEDLEELMEEKMSVSYISEFIPDKYIYVPTTIYEAILPVEDISDTATESGKKGWKGIFGKRKNG